MTPFPPSDSASTVRDIAILGAGAAGLFTAARLSQLGLGARTLLFEKTHKPAAKVLISGGGRCNVTHACFDPKQLVSFYPRGWRELLGPFGRFGPRELIHWFQEQGVELKTESDGRMFPITDQSATIVDCLMKTAQEGQVELKIGSGIDSIEKVENGFCLHTSQGNTYHVRYLLIATGSNPSAHRLIESLGHTITPKAPSLFSLNFNPFPLEAHAGISVEAALRVEGVDLEKGSQQKNHFQGPLLITHTGLSGPAMLRLSAWAARGLQACKYQAKIIVDWLPSVMVESLQSELLEAKKEEPQATIANCRLIDLPKHLLKTLSELTGIDCHLPFRQLTDAKLRAFVVQLKNWPLISSSQSTHKMEFVTCGGVALSEIDFKRFESKRHRHLFFAGEVLDIDAVTGGFNFQNAWTGAWHVAEAIFKTPLD